MDIKEGVAYRNSVDDLNRGTNTVTELAFKVRNPDAIRKLPDPNRFLRCLLIARYICDHNGDWPPDWNPDAAERNDAANTICELAAIELGHSD